MFAIGGDYVAKKKSHRRKKRKKFVPAYREYDLHHIFFRSSSWKTGWAKKLRELPYCKVILPRKTTHEAIHHEIKTVPLPRGVNAKSAVEALEKLERYNAIHNTDSVPRRLVVLIALFDCIEEETADTLRKQLEIVNKFEKLP